MKIGVLTDSTCDFGREFLQKNNIEVIPLNVHFTEEVYQDGVDIQADEFYEKMVKTDKLPTTSQPAVGLFMEKYEEMNEKYDQIISIHLSAKLSGTIESAQLASTQLKDVEIEIIDSCSASLGIGFQALLAIKMINNGAQLAEIKEKLLEVQNNLQLFFTVDDLHYLEKGGRIGKAQAFAGSFLKIKPLLKLNNENGEILPYKKVRGTTKMRQQMISLLRENLSADSPVWLGLLNGVARDNYRQFAATAKNVMEESELDYQLFESRVGPVLGAHVGPSVYGFVLLKGDFLKQ